MTGGKDLLADGSDNDFAVWNAVGNLIPTYDEVRKGGAALLMGDQFPYHEELVEPNPICLLYTSPSPRDGLLSRMPSSA